MIATREQVLSGKPPRTSRRSMQYGGAVKQARAKSRPRNLVAVGAFEFEVPPTGDAQLDDRRTRLLEIFKGTGPDHPVKVGIICEVLEVSCVVAADIVRGLKSDGIPIEPFKSTPDGQYVESYFVENGGVEQVKGGEWLRALIVKFLHDCGAYCKDSAIPFTQILEIFEDRATPVEVADAVYSYVGPDFAVVRAIGVKFKEQVDCYYLIQTQAGLAKYLCELVGESRRISDERNALEGVAKYLAEV